MKTANLIVAAVSLIVMAFVGIYGLSFESAAQTGGPGPAYAPVGLSAIGVVLSIGIIVQSLKSKDDSRFDLSPRLIWCVVIIVVYVTSISVVGYYIPSFLYLASMIWILGLKRPLVTGAVALGFPAAIYLIFNTALNLPMP